MIPPDMQTLRRCSASAGLFLHAQSLYRCSTIVTIRAIFRDDEQDDCMKDHIVEH